MAANMAQMDGVGQARRPQVQQLHQAIYTTMMQNPVQVNGWQSQVQIQQRIGNAMNLVSNSFLAMPQLETQGLVAHSINFEREAFTLSPSKDDYDAKVNGRLQELFKKRQANEHNGSLQNTLNAQQAAVAQANSSQMQARMMGQQANGMQGQMPNGMNQAPQGFQHLQHQMQPSPIPQQAQQQNVGMLAAGLQANPNQQAMQNGVGIRRPGPGGPAAALTEQEKQKIHQAALSKFNNTPEPNRAHFRMVIGSKINPQIMQQLQRDGMDPLMYWFQQQTMRDYVQNRSLRATPMNAANQAMMQQMQAQQQRQMGGLGQQPGAAPGGDHLGAFSNLELMNQQKAGMMAQEAGHVVVPVSGGGPGRGTPQPMGVAPGLNVGNNQPPQGARPPSMQQQQFNQQAQQLKMDQAAAQSQAQIRAQAQAKQMQGQPGGLGNTANVSQSPAMNTLNAPVNRPPVAIGQQPQPQMNPANAPFGQTLDPRFNQGNQRSPMAGFNRQQIINAMLPQIPVEQRQNLINMPQDRLVETYMRFRASQQEKTAAQAQMAGRPQPQNGQFGQGNPMPQLNQGNNVGPQSAAAAMALNHQNPALVQQQLNRIRQNGPQNRQQQQPSAAQLMDSMNLPPKILQQIQVPGDVKKWGQLKQWMAQNPSAMLPNGFRESWQNLQLQHFQNALRSNPAMANNPAFAAALQLQQPQPQPQGQGEVLVPAQGALAPTNPVNPMAPQSLNPNVAAALQNVVVTPQDMQKARAHPSFAGRNLPDEQVRIMLLKMKRQQVEQKLTAQMAQGQQQYPPASQAQQQPAMAMMANPNPPPQATPVSAAPQRPPSAVPDTAAAMSLQSKQQMSSARQTPQQDSSPAVPPRNSLKRPSSDDMTADASNVPVNSVQRPQSQQNQIPANQPMPTAAQLAQLAPEQRAKVEQIMRNRQAQGSQQQMPQPQDNLTKLRLIAHEEQQISKNETLQEVPIPPEQYQDMAQRLQRMAYEMGRIGKALPRWYTLTGDNARARMYFKMRNRVMKQFQDETRPTEPKEKFTISIKDLEQSKAMMESMTRELAAAFPEAVKKTVVPQNRTENVPQHGAQGQATTPGAPVAQAEKPGQSANKTAGHARSGSKSGQPPAAPTTSQPPFHFGGASPHGQPVYTGTPKVTQDNLQLPARKKTKVSAQVGAGAQSSNASPKVGKGVSPDMQKRASMMDVKPPPKPRFVCPESDCEYHTLGFTTDEAKQAHVEAEHIKPYQDPAQFAMESVAISLGLNPDGTPKVTSDDVISASGPLQRSQVNNAAMKRSASAAGTQAVAMTKAESGQGIKGLGPATVPGKADSAMPSQPAMIHDSLNFIDPQNLFSNFGALEFGGGGAISDMNVYRSITPNDTPESSKDSASSEPNSDVSEGMALNVTLDMGLDSWQPFDGDRLVNMEEMEAGTNILGSHEAIAMGDQGLADFTTWDEVNPDFDKPFAFDESLYSFDTTAMNLP